MNKRKYMAHLFIIAVLLSYSNTASAEKANNVITLLEAKINSARIRRYPPEIKITGEQLKNADPCQVLDLLGKYENDPCWPVRERAYRQEVDFAKMRTEPWVKQEVVYKLAKAFVDPNLGLSGRASTWLQTFTEKDFNNKAKLIIRGAMGKPSKGTVLICGVANIQEELPRLKGLLVDELEFEKKTGEHWRFELSWKARLARARMGVKEDVDRCISLIEQEVDTNKNFRLLRVLGYIRQPESIESLKKYFLSDLKLPPTNPSIGGEPYSHYLMPILGDNLSNFPVKKDGTAKRARSYNKEEIELCRKWMSEQTEWKIIR